MGPGEPGKRDIFRRYDHIGPLVATQRAQVYLPWHRDTLVGRSHRVEYLGRDVPHTGVFARNADRALAYLQGQRRIKTALFRSRSVSGLQPGTKLQHVMGVATHLRLRRDLWGAHFLLPLFAGAWKP